MHKGSRLILIIIAMTFGLGLTNSPVFAHSFNVSIILPTSGNDFGSGSESESVQQIMDGFMLATKERDSHPDEQSDGHLGGLDVYITEIRTHGDIPDHITRIAAQGELDIVVVFAENLPAMLMDTLRREPRIVLLLPGRSPFTQTDLPGVRAFTSSYQSDYGNIPSSWSAQGYNAARRIETAVRQLGAVDDKAALGTLFEETQNSYSW